jgi:hypothetical protein
MPQQALGSINEELRFHLSKELPIADSSYRRLELLDVRVPVAIEGHHRVTGT